MLNSSRNLIVTKQNSQITNSKFEFNWIPHAKEKCAKIVFCYWKNGISCICCSFCGYRQKALFSEQLFWVRRTGFSYTSQRKFWGRKFCTWKLALSSSGCFLYLAVSVEINRGHNFQIYSLIGVVFSDMESEENLGLKIFCCWKLAPSNDPIGFRVFVADSLDLNRRHYFQCYSNVGVLCIHLSEKKCGKIVFCNWKLALSNGTIVFPVPFSLVSVEINFLRVTSYNMDSIFHISNVLHVFSSHFYYSLFSLIFLKPISFFLFFFRVRRTFDSVWNL